MSNEKEFNPDLWEPIIGFKFPEGELRPAPSRTHSFLGYLEDIDREPYEVPGLLPKAPEEAKRKFKPR